MSLHGSKMLSLKDQLIEDERAALAELEAIDKEKSRAAKKEGKGVGKDKD